MKRSIESILDIDRKTRELEGDTKRSIDQMDESYRKELSSLEYQRSKEAKEKAKKSYDETLDSFARDIEAVKSASQVQLKNMDLEYSKVKDALVERAFTKILGKESADDDQ
ncbi:Uncharacterised protein [Urinicoccus massiliensis]|uniref:Uncharacterized protein n=1 Tax=Urinicoccus massiliensis TaxID=1723382 RepID=A0A8H2M6K1_9FIRM|nr:hypothetical protein [Urinicoccus massiliensis]KGF07992.1 hypothetical protein HMPREF1633_14535 [Tissierellia bacterium S5-A11]VFB15771.1 Uncharacterised protein [Urinicoccus massiliensis]